MSKIKALIVLGTRPEAIKLAPVIRELQKRQHAGADVRVRICSTGQHREMLAQVLNLFDITPDIDLALMRPGQTPTQVAARVMLAMDPLLQQERPDWVLVQGDTTTVMATAIAAHHLRIRVAHVEAGLRTGDRYNPFPEEMNRIFTSHISDLHFAPTATARANLLREGIEPRRIHLTGNTVIDALLDIARRPSPPQLKRIINPDKKIILVTAHRRENHGRPLLNIISALKTLAQRHPQLQIIYPVHLNPQVREPVYAHLDGAPGITLLPPLDYATLVHLMKRSFLILTDSGGIQEEAPTFGAPVLVLRKTTERPEAVQAGAVRLVGTDTDRILHEAERLLTDETEYAAMSRAVNPYGDGKAAQRIADVLLTGTCEPFVTAKRTTNPLRPLR